MSSSIDERVVEMTFDNREFQQAIQQTLTSLDQLNKGLQLTGATKGLNDVQSAASRFSLAGIASGVTDIASKFQTMSVIAISAISSIVNRAVSAGISLVKSFTLDPIAEGFHNYETQINAIQTILANTGAEGTKIGDVNKALAALNVYANQTIYNFSEMTNAVGTFTAAGVNLKTSVAAIKGIANLAAVSGSNSQQASTAMYQLSQAIAAGTVKLQDWNSVVNAGLGGKTFQNALIETARVNGVQIDKIIKKNGSFRNSLQAGWLTSKILTQTLSEFTGDLSLAQLKAMGFTDKEAEAVFKMGQTAVNAATKIKTITQLTQALKEEVGTAYAAIFKTIFGNITQATDLFSKIHTAAENALTNPIYDLNRLLEGVDKLGGRDKIIDAITNALHAVGAVLKPIKAAFTEIFPPATAKEIEAIITKIDDFSKKLTISSKTSAELKSTFAGLFAVLDIGKQIVEGIFSVLGKLIGQFTKGSGGILEFTGHIGDFLVGLDQGIKKGNVFVTFFDELAAILVKPIKLIQQLDTYLSSFFGNFDGKKAGEGAAKVVSALDPLQLLGETLSKAWQIVIDVASKVWTVIEPLAEKITGFFEKLGPAIASAFSGINYQDVLATFNTGLLAGVVVLIKQVVDKFKKGSDDVSGGLFDTIKETFEGLTGTLKTMQNTLRAATLLEIAAALALLTISVVALSKINVKGLTAALSAMAIMFAQLGASLFVLEKTMSDAKLAKLYLVTGALSGLAIAIDILTIAVTVLSKLSWTQLEKGLSGVAGLLAGLVIAVRLMPDSGSLILQAAGLDLLALAIRILVKAVTELDGLSWSEMEKGLTGVAGLLVSLALFSKFQSADSGGVLAGAGIVLLATGIRILVKAVAEFGSMSWSEIGKGLTALTGALIIMSTTLDAVSPTAPLSAAGVLILATSLGLIGDSLKQLGNLSWGQIGKGLTAMAGVLILISLALDGISPTAPLSAAAVEIVAIALVSIGKTLTQFANMSWSQIGKAMVVLAGSLGIIAVALDLMVGALPGAAATLIVAAALAVLTPVLVILGNMSWGEIAKGMATLAAVFTIFGIAGALLTPVVPTLLGLSAAILLVGAGMALAGVGILAFSAGLTALAISGTAGAVAIVAIVGILLSALPMIAKGLANFVVAFAEAIADSASAVTDASVKIMTALLNGVIKLTPKIMDALGVLLDAMIGLLVKYVPKLTDAGFKILIGFLNGIANNIGKVVKSATDIIVAFINAISANLPRIIDSGVKLIISFINGVANAIRGNTAALQAAGRNLAGAIIDGMTGGLASGVSKVTNEAKKVAKSALNAAKNLLGIHSPSKEFYKVGTFSSQGMADGLSAYSGIVNGAAADVATGALNTVKDTLASISDAVADHIELNPIITPVLDLSGVKKSAAELNDALPTSSITITGTTTSATDAQNGFNNNNRPPDDPGDAPGTTGTGNVIFNQTNNSPKALSSIDIYRQTKNQLSTAKKELPV